MQKSATETAAAPGSRTVYIMVGSLVIVPLLVLLLWLGLRTVSDDAQRRECLGRGGILQVREGVLRQGGPHLYAVGGGRWSLITQGCRGKHRTRCLEESPGIRMLEQHIGQAVIVEFCASHVVGYTVAGQRFRHNQPLNPTP